MAGRRAVIALSIAALALLAACTSPSTRSPTTQPPSADGAPDAPAPAQDQLPAGDDVTVSRIVDGDTLVVTGDERVRLIGIDTPEVNQDECFAAEATDHLAGLVPPGTAVRLVHDVERNDRYGRTLAYLYRHDDGLHVNLAMAAAGYAQQLTIPPNVAHADELTKGVAEARAAGRGLWGAGCRSTATTTASAARRRERSPDFPGASAGRYRRTGHGRRFQFRRTRRGRAPGRRRRHARRRRGR